MHATQVYASLTWDDFFFKEKWVFCWDPLVLLGFMWMGTIHVLGMNSIILKGGRETYFYYLLTFILLLFQTALLPLLSDGQKKFFVFLFNWIVAHWLCSLVGWDVSLRRYCNVAKDKHFHKKQIKFPHLQWDDFC